MADRSDHKHLTEEKILHILKVHEKTDDVSVIDTSLKLGTEKGDNFNGELIACDVKAKVKGLIKDYHWMVKMPPPSDSYRFFVRASKMEEKETQFYGSFFPQLEKFVLDRGADIQFNFCPKVYTEFHEDVEKGSIIVMENLMNLGYRSAINKKKGLSLAHVKLAMEELARLHAASYAFLNSYPGGIDEGLKENRLLTRCFVIIEPEDDVKAMMDNVEKEFYDSAFDLLEMCQEPGQDFVKVFKDFDAKHEGGMTKYRDSLYDPDPNGFNVLCHGDFWFNNMMFRYGSDEVTPEKVCLVDWALTRYTNPCSDLSYFLFNSTTPQLRRTHLDDILEHYHNHLISCLHKLKVDPSVYPYRQFRKDYTRLSFIGFMFALGMVPMVLVNKEDALGQEVMEFMDPSKPMDPELIKMIKDSMKKAYAKEPQIKIMIAGNILEVMENGTMKM